LMPGVSVREDDSMLGSNKHFSLYAVSKANTYAKRGLG
jgi:hypothetical protein